MTDKHLADKNVVGLPPQVMLCASLRAAMSAFGLASDPGPPVGFQFRRRKGHFDVWLYFKGGLRLNVSVQNHLELRTLYDARGWAHDYACRHGFKAPEIRRPSQPKPRPQLRLVKS